MVPQPWEAQEVPLQEKSMHRRPPQKGSHALWILRSSSQKNVRNPNHHYFSKKKHRNTQQDTKEYQNQRGTEIGVFRESRKGGIEGEVKRGEVMGE